MVPGVHHSPATAVLTLSKCIKCQNLHLDGFVVIKYLIVIIDEAGSKLFLYWLVPHSVASPDFIRIHHTGMMLTTAAVCGKILNDELILIES